MTAKRRGIEKMGPNRFRIRVRGKDPRTGKLKEVDKVVKDVDLNEAVRLREAWREEIKRGVAGERPERVTLSTYARSWIESKAARVKWSTGRWYADVIGTHVLPTFGDLYVDAIRKEDVEAWVRRLGETRRPKTVNGILRVLRLLLGDTAEDLEVPNPARRVRPLCETDAKDRRQSLSLAEVRALLAVVRERDPARYPLLLTLVVTGMRWGEATALKWSDVDEEEGVIRVVRGQCRGYVSSPKGKRSRVHPLVPILAEVLREHRQRLVRQQHPGLAEGWIFATRSRTDRTKAALPRASSWRYVLPVWLEAAKIGKHITPHSFRRTNVDLLRRACVDAVVARSLVGHSTEAMRQLYSTVATDEQRQAVDKVVELVQGGQAKAAGGG